MFVVMPHMCKGLAYSYFYNQLDNPDKIDKVINENKRRAYLAHNIIVTRNYKFLFDRINLTDLDMCIVVLTKQRPKSLRYLTQTVASVASQLKNLKNERYSFAVYNVGGIDHKEAYEIGKFVPVVHNKSAPLIMNNEYETQRIGYTSAMKWCLRKNARYNVILEDDIFAGKQFVSNLQFILNRCIRDKEGDQWGFLKLYYPEKYKSWGNSFGNIVELLMFTSLFGFLFAFSGAFVCFGPMTIDTKTFRINVKQPIILCFRIVFTHLCVLIVLLSLGRAHWEELRKASPLMISVVEAKGCCTPAVLYPRTHFKEIIDYLDLHKSSQSLPYDLIIDQFIDERGLRKLLAVPNLVNHIGMISSLQTKGQKRLSEFDLMLPPRFI